MKQLMGEGRADEARDRLLRLAREETQYQGLSALVRLRRKLSVAAVEHPLRVVLLGTGTTDMIRPVLELLLEGLGVPCCFHATEYNTYAREILDPTSGTHAFSPQVAVMVNSPAMLPVRPETGAPAERVAELADELAEHWLKLAQQLHASTDCEVILDNYHALPARPVGSLAVKMPWDTNHFLTQVNARMAERAPAFVHVNDVASLAAQHGIRTWHDERYWFHAKLPVSPACTAAYARSVASIVAALRGRGSKCLVLDLDNTLWGGVVGDDGVGGIKIGPGDAEGEAYAAFQAYVKRLAERGVMLAVCSKNDERNAVAPFAERPEMLIKRDDILCFKANWDPKPDNLRAIARELNIGLDALVFVDDNPVEREHVRQRLPEVRVVELGEDPADYVRRLDETGWFEPIEISREDRVRSEQYRANAAREEFKETVASYTDYLADLEQRAVIHPYEERHLDRIAQLINKSNQFNLTTRRQSRTAVAQEQADPDRLTAYVRLADRFGDNGLISVFSSCAEHQVLRVDQWLMSCRVFNRGVEQLLLNWVVARAKERGLFAVVGAYLPTAKNALVEEHYPRLGFEPLAAPTDAPSGATYWRLDTDRFEPFEVQIRVVDDYEP